MGRLKKNIRSFTQQVLLFPSNQTDQIQMTIKGNHQFVLENVLTLHYYSEQEIIVTSGVDRIHIVGKSFMIKVMYKDELLVQGNITTITFSPTTHRSS